MSTVDDSRTAAWDDFVQALDFAVKYFQQRHADRTIRNDQAQALAGYYEQWRGQLTEARKAGKPPPDAGLLAPEIVLENQRQSENILRYLSFVCHEVKKHEQAGRLGLAQAHACLNEARERLAALRSRLVHEGAFQPAPLAPPDNPTEEPAFATGGERSDSVASSAAAVKTPTRPFMEILLDPRNIQWLLCLGGALLVLGLVIYLYTVGVFENPVVVAGLMGAGTVGLLVGGWALIACTRYQTAGRAITLLACLIMPLNLWFYHAQDLHPFTLYERLWVAALVACGLYAASARVLRDPLFVYVLMAGVTFTSLLILADVDGAEQFWQITHPATLLVVLGLVALHVERAFPETNDGAFTRRRFGLPFFWSGHVVLAAGLLLILGAQIVGYLYQLYGPSALAWGLKQPSPITSERPVQLLALGLVLAGVYAYFYSDLVVRRIGVYVYLAIFALLWAEALALQQLALQLSEEAYIIVLAATALAANLVQYWAEQTTGAAALTPAAGDAVSPLPARQWRLPLARAARPLGLFLAAVPVVLGLWLHAHALAGERVLGWLYVVAMLVTAASCRTGAFVYRHSEPNLSTIYFFGTAAATLMGVAGVLTLVGLTSWQEQAPALMLLPLAYLVAARLYRGRTSERPLVYVAHAATIVMLLSSLAAASQGFALVRGQSLNLALTVFFAEAALFYALAAAFRGQGVNVYLATAMACAAVWQLLTYGQFDDVYYTLTFAIVGLGLLAGYRFAFLERFQRTGLASAAFQCGNALLSLAFVAAALLTLSHLAAGHREAKGALLGMLVMLALASLFAVGLVRHQAWRRWYVVTAVIQAVLTVLVLAVFGALTLAQKLEIVSLVAGGALLVTGHVGWYRERERHSDLVSFSLALGSILSALPLTIAVLYYRSQDVFHWPEELGMLVTGILLLATGFMFQIKSTTLTGALELLIFVLSLLVYLPWNQVSVAAVALMGGGGAIFAIGLVLSLYRDRLLTLPERIKRREGVFRVLSWR